MRQLFAPILALFFFLPFFVFAKDISLQSGTIGVVLSIKPDEIVAREPVQMYLEFKSTSPLFSFKRCNCRIKITEKNGKEILNYQLEQNENYIEDRVKEIPFIFPNTGDYLITISGESTNKVFSPFNMKEKVIVTLKHQTEGEKRWEEFKEWLISLGIPIAVVLITAGIIFRFALKKK
ncbi:MAG: hypothetical protein AAB513_00945 [Patescibacteria group bacterium]